MTSIVLPPGRMNQELAMLAPAAGLLPIVGRVREVLVVGLGGFEAAACAAPA